MPDPSGGPDRSLRLVAEEVQGPVLGDIIASICVSRAARGIIRHGIQRAAMDHSKDISALRPDVQAETA